MFGRLWATDPSSPSGPGVTELDGTVRVHSTSLSAPSVEEPVVAYSYKLEEVKGTTGAGTETGAHYETKREESDSVPFVVETETEQVVVDPADAELSLTSEVEEATDERHTVETIEVLPVGESVYVTVAAVRAANADTDFDGGYVIEQPESVLPESIPVSVTSPFVISDGSEAVTEVRYLIGAVGRIAVGAVLAGGVLATVIPAVV